MRQSETLNRLLLVVSVVLVVKYCTILIFVTFLGSEHFLIMCVLPFPFVQVLLRSFSMPADRLVFRLSNGSGHVCSLW